MLFCVCAGGTSVPTTRTKSGGATPAYGELLAVSEYSHFEAMHGGHYCSSKATEDALVSTCM